MASVLLERKPAAILGADMAGYSRLMGLDEIAHTLPGVWGEYRE
jgi:hypothetical protein